MSDSNEKGIATSPNAYRVPSHGHGLLAPKFVKGNPLAKLPRHRRLTGKHATVRELVNWSKRAKAQIAELQVRVRELSGAAVAVQDTAPAGSVVIGPDSGRTVPAPVPPDGQGAANPSEISDPAPVTGQGDSDSPALVP